MDNQTIQNIKDAIGKSTNIGIVVGKDSTLDRMGAALGLFLLLKSVNKKASIASPSEPIVEISSLVGIDKVLKSFGGNSGDLVVSFPYIDGEIEKVSYTLEDGFLNIIVKASEMGLSFKEKDVRYTRGSGTVDLLIVIGTARLTDLEGLYNPENFKNTKIINIDNNPGNQNFGDIISVTPKASSLSERIAELALTLGLQIDQDIAQNLLAGITSATKNFQDPNTSALAFEMASYLMKHGGRRERVQNEKREERPGPRVAPAQTPRLNNSTAPSPKAQNSAVRIQPQNTASDQSEDDHAPSDWLTPKVYRGSSEV